MKKQEVNPFRQSFLIIVFFLVLSPLRSQQFQNQDSTQTPFRKGRWLTGLTGSIGSNTNKISSSGEKTFTNEFGLDLSTGHFVKDRLLFGGRLSADKSDVSGGIDRTTESFFVGPYLSYYLSSSAYGSLFTTFSPGYVRYRDESVFSNSAEPLEQLTEGGGFGTLFGFGYSYVIHDRIAFDIGFNLNLFWIAVDEERIPQRTSSSENISTSNISFSFGFNVLLDEFFF